MILQWEQIQAIVKDNPNKANIDSGKAKADKLMLHVHAVGMDAAIKQRDYFSSKEVYDEQKKGAISNKDLISRLLQQEDMIFTARGGGSYFSLPDSEESQMHELLDNIRYDMSLRKWIRNVALQAYRCDPMGIVFMEIEPLKVEADGTMNEPRAYPTYKSIYSIFDYLPNGRMLEYVCFRLKVNECKAYGIKDETFKGQKPESQTEYYRIVDDLKDVIVQKKESTVILVTNITQKNPLPNEWKRTPGFIMSDMIKFNNPQEFVSPLDNVVELADNYLYDRSIRNLQKLFHGFAKAIEPLLTCSDCEGTGYQGGEPCKSCTIPGHTKGMGFKLKTKISDVAKFPLSVLENSNFDFRKLFGYATPDIESWNKQDLSLDDLEELMEMTYWGTIRVRRQKPGEGDVNPGLFGVTATEVDTNNRPKEARLNVTADWAESTENKIADFIGRYWFEDGWKKSGISYGRDYILKSADELRVIYLDLKGKSAPDFMLDEALERYYRALYQNNPIMMIKYLKMLDVEPFPHLGITQAKGIVTNPDDYNAKLYFGEWCNTVQDGAWISKPAIKLKEDLLKYVQAKNLVPEPAPDPAVPIN